MYDQGEDRWLCTLMLLSGGRIEFEAGSHCQEKIKSLRNQRNRTLLMSVFDDLSQVYFTKDFCSDGPRNILQAAQKMGAQYRRQYF